MEGEQRQRLITITCIHGEPWKKGGLSHVWGGSVVQGGVQIAQRKTACQKNVRALPNAQETSCRNWENSHGSM